MDPEKKKEQEDELMDNLAVFGTLGYSVDTILSVLDLNESEQRQLTKDFNNPNSKVYKAYHNGRNKIGLALDSSVLNIAMADSLDANDRILKRLRARKVDELLRDRFGLDI